jgi:hypothetical protein
MGAPEASAAAAAQARGAEGRDVGRDGTILFVLALDIALPAAIIFVLSRYGGWSTLAERYPLRGPFPRPRTCFGFGVFRGWVGYNGAIIVASDAGGLYLRGWPVLLSFCHAPIHIPWSEIQQIETRSGRCGEAYRIRTLQAPEVDFALRPQTFALVREDAKRAGVAGSY